MLWDRWTLARVVALIATMFHLRVGITTAWQAMRRLGYTPQLPIHRAIERDEAAIAHWRRYQWPAVKFAGVRGQAGGPALDVDRLRSGDRA